VKEPLAVRLAGEYDVWDKRDDRADLFQHGLRSQELNFPRLLCDDVDYVDELLKGGRVLQYARTKENESVIKHQGFTVQWEGLTFIACNSARFNSYLFTAGLKPEHDGCLGFAWDGGKGKWKVSLYGVPGKPNIDLSAIAVRHGGGGHKQACGFECAALPFQVGPVLPAALALQEIAAERARQIVQEGFTAGHDDGHDEEDLARAAACYAMPQFVRKFPTSLGTYRTNVWPWEEQWWKPTPGNRRREIVKACALLLAEYERLARCESATAAGGVP
jgi:hypothetical protein